MMDALGGQGTADLRADYAGDRHLATVTTAAESLAPSHADVARAARRLRARQRAATAAAPVLRTST